MQISTETGVGFAAVIVSILGAAVMLGTRLGSLEAALTEIKSSLIGRIEALEGDVRWLRDQVTEILRERK